MEYMLPENSFPQICVVSEIESLRIVEIWQEYEGSVAMRARQPQPVMDRRA
jgi:hypothetical protein